MSEYFNPSQITRLEIKRDKEIIIRFTKLEDSDMWEVEFFSDDSYTTICPKYGIRNYKCPLKEGITFRAMPLNSYVVDIGGKHD